MYFVKMLKLNLFNKKVIIVYLLLLLKLFLGLKIVLWGYPIFATADEPLFIKTGLKVLHRAYNDYDFNPYFYDWPNFIIYLNAAFSSIYIGYNFLLGIGPYEIPHINFVIFMRVITLLASLIHVFIIFKIAKKLFDFNVAILVTFITIFIPMYFSYSVIAKAELWYSFFATIVLYYSLEIYSSQKLKDYLLAGFFLALTIGSKFIGIFFCTTILVAHLLVHKNIKLNNKIIFSGLVTLLVFILLSPYTLLDFKNLLISMKSLNQTWGVNFDVSGHNVLIHNLKNLFSSNILGIFSIFFIIFSIILSFKKKYYHFLILLIPSLIYFIFLCQYPLTLDNPRQFLPILPYLILAVGGTIFFIKKKFLMEKKIKYEILIFIFLLGLFSPQVIKTFDIIKKKQIPFTASLSLDWVKANIPKGSNILSDRFSPRAFELNDYNGAWMPELNRFLEYNSIKSNVNYVILNSNYYDRFKDIKIKNPTIKKYEHTYNRFMSSFKLVYELKPEQNISTGGTIRIYENINKVEFKK